MADDPKDDAEAAPRQTYMPKPPSKAEVDQVSREQGMISDEWASGPTTAEGDTGAADGAGSETPAKSSGKA